MDALVIEDGLADNPRLEPLDDRGDAGRAEPFVELAPAGDALIGRELQEVVVAPAGIAAQYVEPGHVHRSRPLVRRPRSAVRRDGGSALRHDMACPFTSPCG